MPRLCMVVWALIVTMTVCLPLDSETTNYWVVSVQKNENKYTRRSVQCQVNRLPRRVLLVAARLLSPWLKPGVLRRDLINWRGECLESHPANALRASFAQAGCKVVPID